MKCFQTSKSSLHPRLNFTVWCGFLKPLVRSKRPRKNARHGITTWHAKLRRPHTNWSSFRVPFFLCKNSQIISKHLDNLSCGNRASCFTVSSSIPKKVILVCIRTYSLVRCHWNSYFFADMQKCFQIVVCQLFCLCHN